MPPLVDCGGIFLIKGLLQDGETVVPILEFVDLALLRARIPALSSFRVKIVFFLFDFKPLPTLYIALRQNECQGLECFFDKTFRENLSVMNKLINS